MIVCTVILALLVVLVGTEPEPEEIAPGADQAPPQSPLATAAPAAPPVKVATDSDRAVIQRRLAGASLSFPSTPGSFRMNASPTLSTASRSKPAPERSACLMP